MDTRISIVIACQETAIGLRECLEVLEDQIDGKDVELLLVNSSQLETNTLSGLPVPLRTIIAPEGCLVPELWGIGALSAEGQAIAFTTTHFLLAPDWLQQAEDLLVGDLAAVGGAIENLPEASVVQWAIYYTRYSAYMAPFEPRLVDQIAGDNAIYARWVIEGNADLIQSGFWEHQINQRLRSQGKKLLLSPALKSTYFKSDGPGKFCRQRYQHGRIFGSERAAHVSQRKRLIYLVASPLIPFLFMSKIIRQVARKRRMGWDFIRSFPLQMLFLLCWSFGELRGYIDGSPARNTLTIPGQQY